MGRARARMEMISNKRTRKLTFEKRIKGLAKKAHELSTLCGVKVCFIVYLPTDSDKPIEAKIWPENPQEIHGLIDSYKKTSDEDRRCRTSDFSFYYKDRTKKAEQDLAILQKKNLEAEFPTWDDRYNILSYEELRQFGSLLKAKLEAMKARVDFMKGTQTYFAETSGNMMSSSCDAQLAQENSYVIQNQNLFRRSSSMEFEILQPQVAMPCFYTNGHCFDVPFQNSFNFNTMLNPQMMLLMNNGASSSNSGIVYDSSDHNSHYQFSLEPAAAAVAEDVSNAGDNANGGEIPLCSYFPAMQPMSFYVPYPLPFGAPAQMYACQTNENYGLNGFQLMDPRE